eukprot:gene22443-34381_t
MGYCTICYPPTQYKSTEHFKKHEKQAAWLRSWVSVLQEECGGHEVDDNCWRDLLHGVHSLRQTKGELQEIKCGMDWLQWVTGEKLIPFGSVIVGTAEKRQTDRDGSDVDVSVCGRTYRGVINPQVPLRLLEEAADVNAFQKDQSTVIEAANKTAILHAFEKLKKLADTDVADLTLTVTPTEAVILGDMQKQILKKLLVKTELLADTTVPLLRIIAKTTYGDKPLLLFSSNQLRDLCASHVPHQACLHHYERTLQFENELAADEAYKICSRIDKKAKLYLPSVSRLSWDVSCRPEFGPRNSALLQKILASAGHPAMTAACAIKRWGKQHGVADSRKGFLSSYAMVLMFCFYLYDAENLAFVDPSTVPEPSETSVMVPPPELTDAELRTCARYVCGFFAYYSKFDWKARAVTLNHHPSTVLSPLDLGFTPQRTFESLAGSLRDHVHGLVTIMDPYEEGVNVARRINYSKRLYITGVLKFTYLAICKS